MDFNQWMQEEGYLTAQSAFEKAKNNMLKKAKSRAKKAPSSKSYEELELYLKKLIFPKDTNDLEISKKFNSLLQQAYQKVTDKALTTDIGALQYQAIIRPTFKESTTVRGRHIQTIKRQRAEIESILKNMKNSGKYDEIANLLEQNKIIVEKTLSGIDEILRDYAGQEKGQLDNKKVIGNKTILDLSKELDAIYNTLSASGAITMKDYGDVLEYGLALLNVDIENTTEKVTDELLDTMLQGKFGDMTVDRGGSVFDATIPGAEKGESFTFGNIKFDYKPSISTGEKKQGKVDIVLTLPDNFKGSGSQFRISAKNWIEINSLHDLGKTDLLSAMSRSIDEQNVIDLYSFTLQDEKHRNLIALSHKIAEISILLDIVMGASQKLGYADTLIIVDRRREQVHIKNIPEMIILTIDEVINTLAIHGYNASELETSAIAARNFALSKPKDEDQSKTFLSFMYNIMKSVEVSVQFILSNQNLTE